MSELSAEEKVKRFRERVELAYAIKEAYGGIYPYDALRDAATRRNGKLSPVEMVAIERGYKPSQ